MSIFLCLCEGVSPVCACVCVCVCVSASVCIYLSVLSVLVSDQCQLIMILFNLPSQHEDILCLLT